MKPARLDFVELLKEQQGKISLWGAKGPDNFDCSGLVTYCLRTVGGPDWRADHNVEKLWAVLPNTYDPKIGDLAFYGPPSGPDHVMVFWGDGRVYGARGASAHVTRIEDARKQPWRRVDEKPLYYRPGLYGFRSLADYLE